MCNISISAPTVSFLNVLLGGWLFFNTSPVCLNLLTIRDTVAGSTPRFEATSILYTFYSRLLVATLSSTVHLYRKRVFYLRSKLLPGSQEAIIFGAEIL